MVRTGRPFASVVGVGSLPSREFKSILQMVDIPHVHIHYLDTNEDCARQGYLDMEVCCHGCHSSLYIRVASHVVVRALMTGEPDPRLSAIKNEFAERHRGCGSRPDVSPGGICTSRRTMMTYLEIR